MLGAGAAAIVSGGAAEAATRSSGGGRAHRTALSALRRYAEQHVRDWGLPGLTLCVVDRDGFAGFITSGYANAETRTLVGPDHLFQIGSISKVFTALTLHSLHQEGKLSSAAHVRAMLPDIEIRDAETVTLQHLLNHTSGLPGNAPIVMDGGLWSGFTPGEHWAYSNTGYELLSRAIAQADEKQFHELLEARVLRPLGMNDSHGAIRSIDRPRYAQGYELLYSDRPSFRPAPIGPAPWVDVETGAGCVAATSADMAKFLRFMIEMAQGRGGPVFSDATAAAFMANPAAAPGWSETAHYGNGLARLIIDDRHYLHHTGGMVSFSSSMHVDAEAGVAAFASSNVSFDFGYRPRDITLQACRLLRAAREGGEVAAPAPTRSIVNDPTRLSGVYTAQSGETFEVRADGADQVAMHRDGAMSRMQSLAGPFFASADPRFATAGILFEVEEREVVRAWADEIEFVRGPPPHTFQAPPPEELQRLAGVYDSDNAWSGTIWIIARAGKLWLNNAEPLTQLSDGSWRAGTDEWSPERLRFDGVIGGRPTRLLLSGSPYVRRFS